MRLVAVACAAAIVGALVVSTHSLCLGWLASLALALAGAVLFALPPAAVMFLLLGGGWWARALPAFADTLPQWPPPLAPFAVACICGLPLATVAAARLCTGGVVQTVARRTGNTE